MSLNGFRTKEMRGERGHAAKMIEKNCAFFDGINHFFVEDFII